MSRAEDRTPASHRAEGPRHPGGRRPAPAAGRVRFRRPRIRDRFAPRPGPEVDQLAHIQGVGLRAGIFPPRPILSRGLGRRRTAPRALAYEQARGEPGLPPNGLVERGSFGSNQEFSAAVGRASSAGWVAIGRGPTGPVVVLKTPDGARALRESLRWSRRPGTEASKEGRVPEGSKQLAADLLRRGLLQRKELKLTMVSEPGQGSKPSQLPTGSTRSGSPRRCSPRPGRREGRRAAADRRGRPGPPPSILAGGTR